MQLAALESLARQASMLLDQRKALMDAVHEAKRLVDLKEDLLQSEVQMTLATEAAGIAAWFFDPARNIVGGDKKMVRFSVSQKAWGRPRKPVLAAEGKPVAIVGFTLISQIERGPMRLLFARKSSLRLGGSPPRSPTRFALIHSLEGSQAILRSWSTRTQVCMQRGARPFRGSEAHPATV